MNKIEELLFVCFVIAAFCSLLMLLISVENERKLTFGCSDPVGGGVMLEATFLVFSTH